MGSTHAWETLGDGIAPDIQAVAKGLGGGYDICSSRNAPMLMQFRRYASIGAVLISKKVAEGIRGKSGLWKHGHTYQVSLRVQNGVVLLRYHWTGPPASMCRLPRRPTGDQIREPAREYPRPRCLPRQTPQRPPPRPELSCCSVHVRHTRRWGILGGGVRL